MTVLLERHAMDGGKICTEKEIKGEIQVASKLEKQIISLVVKERGIRIACNFLQYNFAKIKKEWQNSELVKTGGSSYSHTRRWRMSVEEDFKNVYIVSG